jgi:hypothetical protein
MREYRPYGSVRGAPGNRRLYRDHLQRIHSNPLVTISVRRFAPGLERTSLAAQRVVQLRYASRAKYFSVVAAGGDRIYALTGRDSVIVLSQHGDVVGSGLGVCLSRGPHRRTTGRSVVEK